MLFLCKKEETIFTYIFVEATDSDSAWDIAEELDRDQWLEGKYNEDTLVEACNHSFGEEVWFRDEDGDLDRK